MNADAEFVWVLGPMDGTAAFVAEIPVFGCPIGLAQIGRLLVGIIETPMTSDLWSGVAGDKAERNGMAIRTRPCPDPAPGIRLQSRPRAPSGVLANSHPGRGPGYRRAF